MARDDHEVQAAYVGDEPPPAARARARWRAAVFGVLALAVLALGLLWLSRERIAQGLIAGELERLQLPATYRIVSIGPRRQVLADVVIGDPARPDLTIERVEVGVSARSLMPALGRITLVRPRLRGGYRNGKLSFGSLDKVLFTGKRTEPFLLPDLDLAVVDGGLVLDTDQGRVGVKLDGAGRLRDGFAGTIAALAPEVNAGGCRARRASVYGRLSIDGERPRFAGPIRLASLACPDGLALADATAAADATFDPALDGVQGSFDLASGALSAGRERASSTRGNVRFTWRKRAVTARYSLAAAGLATTPLAARSLAIEGVLRADDRFSRLESEGTVAGEGLLAGAPVDAALAAAAARARASFAEPLLDQFRTALRREGGASTLSGSYLLRRDAGRVSLVVPSLSWRGASGGTLLAVSRLQLVPSAGGVPGISANFATGGAGMPQLAGRIERGAGGGFTVRLRMAEYRAGGSRLAIPELVVVQPRGGALGLAGEAQMSGPLPGGAAEGLVLPVSGTWSIASGLTLWPRCTEVRFDAFQYANLRLDARRLQLCPPSGGAIVRADREGLRIAAGAPSLAVSGRLGATPIRIATGAIGFALPGVLKARAVQVGLGPVATQSRFAIADLDARVGREIAGRFSGSEVRLAAVPLDLVETGGRWRYADGRLTIADASFRLLDRPTAEREPRFEPLVARGASLTLANNRIVAEALLREPANAREVVRVAIVHDLSSGRGNADLAVENLAFDKQLQPATLTRLAFGVVANAEGVVRGSGRIDWNPQGLTSSGRFTTDALDFAAAFGPVKGASGTIVFTDLLGLVTAPSQTLRIASVNPGIEATDGIVTYELRPGQVIAIEGGRWPFLGGSLTLEPAEMRIGVPETRRYTLVIEGLDAARLMERMEIGNLLVTGRFDGRLPLVFDQDGGRIEGGMLRSRAGGGNVSYVGELTYKDLSTMANFAFDALKSLDYREMTVGMDGALAGEIVTRLRFSGVTQGDSARRNFITERIGRLPIQFNVNIRAPFLRLVSSFRSLWDPKYIRDPRELGLIGADGRPLPTPPGVQAPESGKLP